MRETSTTIFLYRLYAYTGEDNFGQRIITRLFSQHGVKPGPIVRPRTLWVKMRVKHASSFYMVFVVNVHMDAVPGVDW